MWVGLLTERINNNKLEKSNLINEHALIREPVPLNFGFFIQWQHMSTLLNQSNFQNK